MDAEVRKEARLRTLELSSYEKEKALLDEAELRLKRLYNQTHETINGRKVNLSKRRRIAKAKKMLDALFIDDIDVRDDAINTLKVMNNT